MYSNAADRPDNRELYRSECRRGILTGSVEAASKVAARLGSISGNVVLELGGPIPSWCSKTPT